MKKDSLISKKVADKLHSKVLVVAVVSLSVLVLGFLLLNMLGISIVGQAWSSGQNPPTGYYWEEEPILVQTGCSTTSPTDILDPYYGVYPAPFQTCCDASNYCGTYPDAPNFPSGQNVCYNENSYRPEFGSGLNYPVLCGVYQDKLAWISCDQDGLMSLNEKILCASQEWTECDENSEEDLLVSNKYFCDGNIWLTCDENTDSPYCNDNGHPLRWDLDVSNTDAFLEISSVTEIELKGDSVQASNSVDLAENKIFYNTIDPQKTAYFKYDGTFYKIEFDQQFKLSVSTIADQEIASETLQSDDKVHFNSAQLDLDFDNDNSVDAYVNMLAGTPYGNQELLLVVSPRPDFDNYEETITILSSGDTKEFSFQGDYAFNMFENQGNYIMVIQNEQYIVTPLSQGTHYLDELNTRSIGYISLRAFDNFVILDLDTISEYTSLALSPQDKVNLTLKYEAHFDNNLILDIKDNNFGLVSICENDPPVLYTLTVCSKTEEIFDLTDGEVHVEGDLLFLYHSPEQGGAKTGNVYKIIDLQTEKEQLATIFANNLVDGKSVVLKAHEEYYLLSHEGGSYLDLT